MIKTDIPLLSVDYALSKLATSKLQFCEIATINACFQILHVCCNYQYQLVKAWLSYAIAQLCKEVIISTQDLPQPPAWERMGSEGEPETASASLPVTSFMQPILCMISRKTVGRSDTGCVNICSRTPCARDSVQQSTGSGNCS